MNSTNSDPGSANKVLSIAKKLAFFRANVNSADEGIDDFCIGINGRHHLLKAETISLHDDNAGSSSDTEGEDMVSEEDESKRDKSNGHHYNPDDEEQGAVTNEIRYYFLLTVLRLTPLKMLFLQSNDTQCGQWESI